MEEKAGAVLREGRGMSIKINTTMEKRTVVGGKVIHQQILSFLGRFQTESKGFDF